jgi:ribonuclease D
VENSVQVSCNKSSQRWWARMALQESQMIDAAAQVERAIVHSRDLPREIVEKIRRAGVVACDMETSGLDWRNDKIATCQMCVPHEPAVVVQVASQIPGNLVSVLSDCSIQKVFHHAMFDLRFACYQWNVDGANIACTKILSKLLDKDKQDHTLRSLLRRHLGLDIEKNLRFSNWFAEQLSDEQICYAARDVAYLVPLFETLVAQIKTRNLWDLAQRCFEHLPTRVKLEINGYGDVYEH